MINSTIYYLLQLFAYVSCDRWFIAKHGVILNEYRIICIYEVDILFGCICSISAVLGMQWFIKTLQHCYHSWEYRLFFRMYVPVVNVHPPRFPCLHNFIIEKHECWRTAGFYVLLTWYTVKLVLTATCEHWPFSLAHIFIQ